MKSVLGTIYKITCFYIFESVFVIILAALVILRSFTSACNGVALFGSAKNDP